MSRVSNIWGQGPSPMKVASHRPIPSASRTHGAADPSGKAMTVTPSPTLEERLRLRRPLTVQANWPVTQQPVHPRAPFVATGGAPDGPSARTEVAGPDYPVVAGCCRGAEGMKLTWTVCLRC